MRWLRITGMMAILAACEGAGVTTNAQQSQTTPPPVPQEANATIESPVTEDAAASADAMANLQTVMDRTLVFVGYEKDGKIYPIDVLVGKISLQFSTDPFDKAPNAFWATLRTGSLCYDHPQCKYYQRIGPTLTLNSAARYRTPRDEGDAKFRGACMTAPTVECDFRNQPIAERNLIREFTKNLYADAKEVKLDGQQVKLVSAAGLKTTLLFELK